MSKRGIPVTKAIREMRRQRAEKRQADYDKLSLQEKLDRLPEGGANKQRAKLEVLLKKQQEKNQPKPKKEENK